MFQETKISKNEAKRTMQDESTVMRPIYPSYPTERQNSEICGKMIY